LVIAGSVLIAPTVSNEWLLVRAERSPITKTCATYFRRYVSLPWWRIEQTASFLASKLVYSAQYIPNSKYVELLGEGETSTL
jgi:hypothetical protein